MDHLLFAKGLSLQISYYVINLDDNPERLRAFAAHIQPENIAYERVAAVDGRHVSPASFPSYSAKAAVAFFGRGLLGGEVACCLSHIDALNRFMAGDAPYAIIFEDDAWVAEDFTAKVERAIALFDEKLPGWQLLHLYPRTLRGHSPITAEGGHTLFAAHEFAVGTAAIVYSRAGAKAVLETAVPIYAPWDVHLKEVTARHGKSGAITPALIQTSDAPSEIAAYGARRSQIKGLRGWWNKRIRVVRHRAYAIRNLLRYRLKL
ncbi:glycosyltransferase family 25 protein [Ketogulonicigenium vulgare]|uniref:Glycosyl transferase, family 25 n=1 Tax=Ketogulonicigenium vulgare (strain WSH-001) TaxID=759362 RepID=F9Y5N3_KETVW|nr:glycosyltransferase family 25 protein [Ketogulonicigenium vulgare]ADO43689.1 glycosyl transferase, family 25 [Ketogulonicigenium vulgare Y25]AEM41958.1 Glycosyl transferase, family 25 [Ketogulonicigenium vulgare WSH-001]ALJ82059.1 glycosyl transferase [Ketogulonicigenium vulgare]ANW34686.1 glycosyl transferase [Ketogulonicigenium vulgare]AOZ55723.1 glycosyl transferase, family 25 [Ketogulonicigenium vulgare]